MTLLSQPPTLEGLFDGSTLPGLPQSAIALMALAQNRDAGPKEFARPISADPGLMGQVLRFVNSSYFGFSRQITSIEQALMLVGPRTITNFALWKAVFTVIPAPRFGQFDLKRLWQDSLRRALFARNLGKRLRLECAEGLFAGALLQDMAIPLLLEKFPHHYAELLQRCQLESLRLSQVEQECFGWNHATAAALMAGKWNLPASFIELVEQHTDLESLLDQVPLPCDAACVALGACLPGCADTNWRERTRFMDGLGRLCPAAVENLGDVWVELDQETVQFAALLKLPPPPQSLAIQCGLAME